MTRFRRELTITQRRSNGDDGQRRQQLNVARIIQDD
jgi:hypothetical protein